MHQPHALVGHRRLHTEQHNGQTEIEDLGPQNGAVALHIHLLGIFGVVVQRDRFSAGKALALGGFGVVQAVAAALGLELKQISRAVPALNGACHPGLHTLALLL